MRLQSINVINNSPKAEKEPANQSGAHLRIALTSATGSMPQHMMALIVAWAIQDGIASTEHAGWLSGAFVLGMLFGSSVLPQFLPRASARSAVSQLAIAAIALTVSLWVPLTGTVLCWVVVGICSGGLLALGSLFAATISSRSGFLQLRLGLVLLMAAGTISAAHLLGALASYTQVVMMLASLFAVMAVFTAAKMHVTAKPVAAGNGLPKGRDWLLAAGVVVFFFGQPGFMAFAAHRAADNGISLDSLPVVYALCKLAAAAHLLVRLGPTERPPSLVVSSLLAFAVVLMANADSLATFAAALLVWELCVNVQSTRLQSLVLERTSSNSGRWLAAAISLGAACGPITHGWLLETNLGEVFLLISIFAAFSPVACRAIHHPRMRPEVGPIPRPGEAG